MLFGYSVSFQLFDKGIIETLGGKGLVTTTFQSSRLVSSLHSGYLSHLSAIFITSVIFLSAYSFLVLFGVKPSIGLMAIALLYVAYYN